MENTQDAISRPKYQQPKDPPSNHNALPAVIMATNKEEFRKKLLSAIIFYWLPTQNHTV